MVFMPNIIVLDYTTIARPVPLLPVNEGAKTYFSISFQVASFDPLTYAPIKKYTIDD